MTLHKHNYTKSSRSLLKGILLIAFVCIAALGSYQLVEAQYGSPSLVLSSKALSESPEKSEASRERLTIVAPRRLRPQSDYHILVSLARSEAQATIDLTITGARDSNQEHTETRSILAQSGETKTVKFTIGDWPSAEYVLNVSALASDKSWNFTQEAQLQYQAKKFSILVQTDKAIYKPGEEVKFRAIFLTPQLNPQHLNNEVNVTITDPRRNIVKQFLSESDKSGVIAHSMLLSQDPMMGDDWLIRVEARGQTGLKRFQVAEYILPTFDIHIDLPSFATYNESDIVASVRAAYTYGKPVDAYVTLTVQPKIRYLNIQTRPLDSHQFKGQLDPASGKVDFQLDLMKDLWLEREHYEREIEFFALVEEKLTGRKYNKTETMFIYEKPIRIDLLNAERTFKPGLPHLLQFRVSYQDGRPVEENGPEMVVRVIGENQELINTTNLRPSGPGLASFWLDVPKFIRRTDLVGEEAKAKQDAQSSSVNLQTLNYLDVQVMYRNQVHHVGQLSGQKTKSNEHLSIMLDHLNSAKLSNSNKEISQNNKKSRFVTQQAISVGDELKIQVKSTEPMALLTCHGMARGDIVWALTREPRNESEYQFSVLMDQRMTPRARVMCFYVHEETREIITDLITFPVDGLFRNNLKLSLSTDETKPGKQIEIRALTKPNSLVALSAVDESVLLLKSGHDIEQDDLKHETESYGSRFSDSNEAFWGSSATSADRLFQQADVIVLTNNNIFNGWEFRSSLDANDGYNAEMLSGKMYTAPIYADNARQRIELANPGATLYWSPDLLNLKENSRKLREHEPVVIRSQFPETWLWQNGTANGQGEVLFEARVPDTITSWHLNGFSLNEQHGFGLSNNKPILRVFRPFFVTLNLPYSIIRGETLNIQCVVFNYSPKGIQARVTFDNHLGEFDFIEASNEIDDDSQGGSANVQAQLSRQIRLDPEQGVPVSFLVRPRRLGHLDVRIVARSDSASSDGIVKKLLVKSEGQTQFMNKAILLNLDDSSIKRNLSIEIPPNAVAGSQKVFVSAIGDVMGAGLANVDDLLRLPYGCGEQNMINLVPNIVLLNYLISTGRLREPQRQRALRNIETGYQRQLNYKRRDGSFSAFGESDANGSVWLTAYVLKTFQQARPLIKVDPKVVHRAANYLAHFSMSDGSIRDSGMIHDKRLQSSANEDQSKLYLTAYTMIAFLQAPIESEENTINGKPLDEVVQRGVDLLEMQLNSRASSLTTYDIAIVTYALQLAARQASAARGYQLLWAEAREDPQTGGIWWSNGPHAAPNSATNNNTNANDGLESESSNGKLVALNEDSESAPVSTVQPPLIAIKQNKKHSAHLFLPESLNIEMTSLALLSTIRQGELDRALPIVKWLVGQQNSQGGFASTQDTVLAIEALGAFASATAAAKSKPSSMEIEITYPRVASNGNSSSRATSSLLRRNNVEQLMITSSNELVQQQLRLTTNNNFNLTTTNNDHADLIKWLQIRATGSGSGVVQVSWQYNLLVSAEKPAFYLNPYVDRSSNINYLQLSVCTYYKQAGESSNMALVDIELPSGYLADLDALPSLKRSREVKRIDTTEGDTRVLVYLDRVTNEELCFTVPAHRGAKVSNNKPVPVNIYDYYDRHKAARIFYEPILARSCDICDSDSCSKSCTNQKLTQETSAFKSLHDQRKLLPSSSSNNNNKTNDKLQQANGSEGASSNLSKLLPLAPVLMSLISLFN